MANFVSFENAQSIMNAIAAKFATLNSAYVAKGNSTFAALPATPTGAQVGFVYNVTTDFTTDARFVEGAGKNYKAGTNVVIVDNSTYAAATPVGSENPSTEGWYELVSDNYILTTDTAVDPLKTYYIKTTLVQYDVISTFVDIDSINQAIAKVAAMIAPKFNAANAYAKQDLVTKDNVLYYFITAHTAGDPWDPSEVTSIDVVTLINVALAIVYELAPIFNAANAYAVGDLVIYGFRLCKFKSAHTAGDPWDGSEVDIVTVSELLTAEATARTNADTAILADIAAPFNAANAYVVGNVVTKDNNLYMFTSAHTAGNPWSSSEVDSITVEDLIVQEAFIRDAVDTLILHDLADEFDATKAYAIGDFVIKTNSLYKFTSAHTAGDPWSGSEVDVVQITDLISELKSYVQIPEFSTTENYSMGDLVTYNNKIYIFTSPHTAGPWNSSETNMVCSNVSELLGIFTKQIQSNTNNISRIRFDIAPTFDTTTNYSAGDIVTYDYEIFEGFTVPLLYKFKVDHTAGAWNPLEVETVTVASLLTAEATTRANAVSALANNLADTFNAANAYAIGDIVIKDNGLYKFKAAHTAGNPWSSSEVDAVQIADLIGDGFKNIEIIIPPNITDYASYKNAGGNRGEDITKYWKDGSLADRIDGVNGFKPFEDLYLWDYIDLDSNITAPSSGGGSTTGTKRIHIGEFNGLNNYQLNKVTDNTNFFNHLRMVTGTHFGMSKMNDSNTTANGYLGSKMHTDIIGNISTSGTLTKQLYDQLGSLLVPTTELLTNSINPSGYNRFGANSGCSNNWTWTDVYARLLSEIESNGSIVWSSSGYDTGNAQHQLPAFKNDKSVAYPQGIYYWLKDVATSTYFCYSNGNNGNASYNNASLVNYVRLLLTIGRKPS